MQVMEAGELIPNNTLDWRISKWNDEYEVRIVTWNGVNMKPDQLPYSFLFSRKAYLQVRCNSPLVCHLPIAQDGLKWFGRLGWGGLIFTDLGPLGLISELLLPGELHAPPILPLFKYGVRSTRGCCVHSSLLARQIWDCIGHNPWKEMLTWALLTHVHVQLEEMAALAQMKSYKWMDS